MSRQITLEFPLFSLQFCPVPIILVEEKFADCPPLSLAQIWYQRVLVLKLFKVWKTRYGVIGPAMMDGRIKEAEARYVAFDARVRYLSADSASLQHSRRPPPRLSCSGRMGTAVQGEALLRAPACSSR